MDSSGSRSDLTLSPFPSVPAIGGPPWTPHRVAGPPDAVLPVVRTGQSELVDDDYAFEDGQADHAGAQSNGSWLTAAIITAGMRPSHPLRQCTAATGNQSAQNGDRGTHALGMLNLD